jgi:hypothetical protein
MKSAGLPGFSCGQISSALPTRGEFSGIHGFTKEG